MQDEIFAQLQKFIIRNYMVEEDEVDWDDSLIDQGVIDSIGLIEIVSYLETTYEFKITDDLINRENFGSPKKIALFAESQCMKKE